jgi:hypothetical protein
MAVNKEQHEYFCAACGGGIAEEEFEAGGAIRREDKTYCRKCFRQKFPDECEAHPGAKASVRCSVCRRTCCENCVIEIAGKQVCSRCKDWALGKLEDGEVLAPDSSLFPDFDKSRRKRKRDIIKKAKEAGLQQSKSDVVRDQVLFRRRDSLILLFVGALFVSALSGAFYLTEITGEAGTVIFVSILMFVLLFISLVLPRLTGGNSLRTVQVDDWGITGMTFRGKKKQVAWEEVALVTIKRPNSSSNLLGVIKIYAGRKNLMIGTAFPRFMFIADAVRDTCEEKGIRHEERAV